jgi:hypothetical protein
MKQKDIALIIVVVFISAVMSFFVSTLLFASPANRQQQAEIVQPITDNFVTPASQYFNGNSIDPTQLIQIGNNNNTNPFNGTGQQ